jgi:hypothetical protein
VFLSPRHMHRGFVASLSGGGGGNFVHCTVEEVVPFDATLSGPDTSPGTPEW